MWFPTPRAQQVLVIFVGPVRRVKPEQITGGLRCGVSHTKAFGYRQNGCRPEPKRNATLCTHVRMHKRITGQKFLT